MDNLNTMEDWISTARETKVLEERLMTTDAQLQRALLDIEELDTDVPVDVPDTGNDLLAPSAIIGLGIIIAAVLLLQKTGFNPFFHQIRGHQWMPCSWAPV